MLPIVAEPQLDAMAADAGSLACANVCLCAATHSKKPIENPVPTINSLDIAVHLPEMI